MSQTLYPCEIDDQRTKQQQGLGDDPVVRAYARRAVPRYTSYPTVPHFNSDFTSETYKGFLASLDAHTPISLYIHIPFCRQMCWYCACNMKLIRGYEPVAAYVETLLEEIQLVARALPGRMTLSHVHFGGGTPTALEPEDLKRIMAVVRAHFDFTEGAELALEVDPRTLTEAMAQMAGDLGFNRASLGIQDFNMPVQAAINRIQPPETVRRALRLLRDAGIKAINFDLIYGLPHQTVDAIERTVDLCTDMAPDRFALFGYAHVPWMAKNQRMIPDEALPDTTARADQAEAAARALARKGFEAIGLDHFARAGDSMLDALKEGSLRRNFQGYSTDPCDTLIGLGATSISKTPMGYAQNISETGAWSRAVKAGDLPVARGHSLNDADRRAATAIEAIMCFGTVDLLSIAAAPDDRDWFMDALERLAPMVTDGLVSFDGRNIRLTERGRPLMRVAASAFDDYLAAGKARHSVAV